MQSRALRIWLIMILPVILIGWLLYNRVQSNKAALETQGNTSIIQLRDFLEYSWQEALKRYQNRIDRYIESDPQLGNCAEARITYNFLYGNAPKIKRWPPGASEGFEKPDSIIAKITHRYSSLRNNRKCTVPDSLRKTENYRYATTFSSLLTLSRDGGFFDYLGVYDKWGTPLHLSGDALLHSSLNVNDIYNHQTLGIQKYTVPISGSPYSAYILPADINGKIVYVCGFINDYRFKVASRRLSFTLLSILVFVMALILASFPILRVVMASRADFIKKEHIYNLGLSLTFATMMVGIFISFSMTSYNLERSAKKRVETGMKKIEEIQTKELEELSGILHNCSEGPGKAYSENVCVNLSSGEAEIMLSNQLVIYDTLKSRHYVKNAKSQQAHYLGSHLSLSSGEVESVLSHRIANEEDAENQFIEAITFNPDKWMNDFNEQLSREDFRYMLIKTNGDIFYSPPVISTYFMSVSDAFGKEKANELKDLMRKGNSLSEIEVPLFFNGSRYVGHLSKLQINPKEVLLQENLWILAFRDINQMHLRSYSSMLMSVFGYLFYIFILLLLLLGAYFSQKKISPSSSQLHSYSWFRPKPNCQREYNLLSVIMMLHIVWLLALCAWQNNPFITMIACGMSASIVSLCNYVLLSGFWQRKKFGKLHSGDYLRIVINSTLTLLLILLFIGVQVQLSGKTILWLNIINGVQILLVSFILILLTPIGLKSKPLTGVVNFAKNASQNFISRHKQFYLCFAFWVIIFGLMPGFVIHHTSAHLESEVWEYVNSLKHTHDSCQNQWLVTEFEYFRRELLSNYTELPNKAVARYFTPSKTALCHSMTHTEDVLGTFSHFNNLIFMILFLIMLSLFPISSYLHRLIYLFRFKNYQSHKFVPMHALAGSQPYLFIETLHPPAVLRYLPALQEKVKKTLDLSNPDRGNQLSLEGDIDAAKTPGMVMLLNSQCCHSQQDFEALIAFISYRYRNALPITVLCSYDLRAIELSVKRNPNIPSSYLNTASEVLAPFVSLWVPIGLEYIKDDANHRLLYHNEFYASPLTHVNQQMVNLQLSTIGQIQARGHGSIPASEELIEALRDIEKLHQGSYLNIWHELSFSEKKMVYNLATEGYLNFLNTKIIRSLMRKGVFRFDQREMRITLFSESFREFATIAPPLEVRDDFKKDTFKNGNSKNIRYALITLLFIIIFAISWYNVGTYDQIVKVISGSLAIISSLLAFFGNMSGRGFFGKSSNQQ